MELTRKAALLLLRTTFILLCKLLLVDVVCTFVGGWLVYFLAGIDWTSTPHSNNVRSQEDPGIHVIICGLPRSGSSSLRDAMDILGFPCLHASSLIKPSLAKLLMKAQLSGAHQDLKHLLHGYRSVADFPAATFYKELMEIYPNAKIILNTRDPESWYRSFSQTMLQLRGNLTIEVVKPWGKRCSVMFYRQKLLRNKPENEEVLMTNYKLHVQEVKRHVPSHKLYVLDIENNEGWAPLCKFLEIPVPNVPFPFVNKRDSFMALAKNINNIYTIVLISYLAFIFIIISHTWTWIVSKY